MTINYEMNPYQLLPQKSFWKNLISEGSPLLIKEIYQKKFEIDPNSKIATAGSCFAQHISQNLSANGYSIINQEPAPSWLPKNLHHNFGYSIFSARYGNIYTVSQLLQLTKEVMGHIALKKTIWERDGRYYDAFRPLIEPNGFESELECALHRKYHLANVYQLFTKMDIFIFTLGLTEGWIHTESNTVFPSAPGVIAGEMNEDFSFINFRFNEIVNQFNEFLNLLKTLRNGSLPQIILTVSPVPLTATGTAKHILPANNYSKSVLRAAAGQLEMENLNIDYFPSYEIITNPASRGIFYSSNLRTINSLGVKTVMEIFFKNHPPVLTSIPEGQANVNALMENHSNQYPESIYEQALCDEAILEAFSK
jgi:hypothetical protein